MINLNSIGQIKEHLEKAQNPLFFFDNDADGLCSFLLLARKIGAGKGVAIKSFPELDSSYSRKIYELNPDYVFILDKPMVSKDFIEIVKDLNIPIVWIDHHDVEFDKHDYENLYYYNPVRNNEKQVPTTYICWKATEKKEDLWVAFAGCVSDNFMPDFIKEFKEIYPEMLENEKSAFDILYKTQIGKITRILNFALKDTTSNVVKMIKFLLKAKSPNEVLEDSSSNTLIQRFNQINKKYQEILKKAEISNKKLVYFEYSGDLSLSADISNELAYKYPEKLIVVAYIKSGKVNISIRGKNARKITLEAIKDFKNATGGGHENATGCKVSFDDLKEFKERIETLTK